jgi:uncharacterized protein YjiS (DUF1127 family)
MADHKVRIETAKIRIEKAKRAQTVAETEKKAAEKQQAEVTQQLADLGVTPETAAAEIAKLDSTVDANLTKVEGLIPNV